MSDVSIPPTICPFCGYKMDRTTAAYGEYTPQEGDISLCLCCAEVCMFTKDLHLRKPNEKERLRISLMPHVIQAQLAMRALVGDKIKNRIKKATKNRAESQ